MATTEDGPVLTSDVQSTTQPTRTKTVAAPSATTAPTTRRRAKSFLRNYYGIQQINPTNQDGPKEGASAQPGPISKADPYDLDSHVFEVDKYMHKMFVEKQLPGLVQADNELVADIRQLDGDMKTLVYENYSKFLSATDTINKMKSNVDNLESEMSRLTQNISKIATSSATIHSSLGTKREKIRQLNGVHSLLTKHYKHLTVFTGIEKECKTIMVQIAQRIRLKMCADRATVNEISECVGLLLALKEEPVALQRHYLDLSLKYLDKVYTRTLEDIKALPLYVPPTVSIETSSSPKSSHTSTQATISKRTSRRPLSRIFSAVDVVEGAEGASRDKEVRRSKSTSMLISGLPPADKVSYLNAYYLRHVEGFVVSFRNYYLATPALSGNNSSGTSGLLTGAGGDAMLTSNDNPTTSGQRQSEWVGKDSRVYANLTKEQQEMATVAVKEVVSTIVRNYLDTVGSFLDYPLVGFDAQVAGLIQKWETQLIRRALGTIKEKFMERTLKRDDKLLNTNEEPDERLLDSIQEHTSGATAIDTPQDESSGLAVILKETTGWIHEILKTDTIPFMEKYINSDAQFLEAMEGRKLFLKNFQDGFKTFWDEVLKAMQQAASPSSSPSKPCSRTLPLIMSQLCFQLSNTVVEQAYRSLSKTLFRPGEHSRPGSFLLESYEEPPMIPQLQWDCVSGAWEQIFKQLNDIEGQVILVYGDDSDRTGNRELSSESIRRESVFRATGHGHGGGSGGNGSHRGHRSRLSSFGSNTMNNSRFFETQQRNLLLSNIDKLFSDRVEIFIRCQDLNRTGIMFGIIKILLKAWAESVRTKTFGKGGFQQIQVDAEFAKVWLWRFATADERLMHSLLEETQQTAFRRCIDPTPLDLHTVESFIHSER
ncbi:Vacuolar protein sorting-associated protein 51 [Mortierella sp. NVP85]|nr:Vacuolar protein sorting-associated protein 51 [Mortierella sp. NVP85]